MLVIRRDSEWPFVNRSPFEELNRMRREMERLTDGITKGVFHGPGAGVYPLINLTESNENYFVRAELPGIKADDIEISVTGDSISITGERTIPAEDENAKYHRKERESGKFNRILSLPGQINTNKVEAKSVDGILNITLPKAEEAKPKKISVKK